MLLCSANNPSVCSGSRYNCAFWTTLGSSAAVGVECAEFARGSVELLALPALGFNSLLDLFFAPSVLSSANALIDFLEFASGVCGGHSVG